MADKLKYSGQYSLPLKKPPAGEGYDIYPSFNAGEGKIHAGFASLVPLIIETGTVVIDGYAGIFWDLLCKQIIDAVSGPEIRVRCIFTNEYLKSEKEIVKLILPFTGGNDPLFGTRCTLSLADFYRMPKLMSVSPDPDYEVNIIIGPGASLAGWKGLLIYADLPKNEQQYRARAGKTHNLGFSQPADSKTIYKHSYFIDWPVLNRHKQDLITRTDVFIDVQRPHEPVWMRGNLVRDALTEMSRNMFRVRPWFEPGPWGGTWIKDNIRGLNPDVPNFAWSFELISPENGLLLESSSFLLEISFDSLMYLGAKEVLGECHGRFGTEFPIRFDFLDTFDGGNLSVQCHPRPEYTREHFGEHFTQEESYYILDTKDDAIVYLGFQKNIDHDEFTTALKTSAGTGKPLDVDRYVQKQASAKHDLFLIPYGTIHGSGKNNMVLEISTTPYIFTFKMYDWLRMDLNGRPRDLNIDRALRNLFFERKGDYVRKHLKAKPVKLKEGHDWQLWHLPTHETHLYDVLRYNFTTTIDIHTDNKCLVMNLVEGQSITVETHYGLKQKICYAETFIVTAAAEMVRITNHSEIEAMLVIAFVK